MSLQDVDQYREAVIIRFKSGNASDAEWECMSRAVLAASEQCGYADVKAIDRVLFGECVNCHEPLYGEECDCLPADI